MPPLSFRSSLVISGCISTFFSIILSLGVCSITCCRNNYYVEAFLQRQQQSFVGQRYGRSYSSIGAWKKDSLEQQQKHSITTSLVVPTNSFHAEDSSSMICKATISSSSNIAIESNRDDVNGKSERESSSSNTSSSSDMTHFCFLIHGYQGLSTDLRYMQLVMRRKATTIENKLRQQECKQQQELVVHNSICNEYKTKDGIQNGGDRLVNEMKNVITSKMTQKLRQKKLQKTTSNNKNSNIVTTKNDSTTAQVDDYYRHNENDDDKNDNELQDITISIVGNSLGGLFGRYAIAKLLEQCTQVKVDNNTDNNNNNNKIKGDDNNDTSSNSYYWIMDGKYRIYLNTFVTTATPHLGVSKHTYIPLSRSAEIGIAHIMGDTGKDLFRIDSESDLIYTMATCPTYLSSLSQFRKRIAYANAFGTDIPVPATTAAFLSNQSTYPHMFLDSTDDVKDARDPVDEVAATTNTMNSEIRSSSSNSNDRDDQQQRNDNEDFIIGTLVTDPSYRIDDDASKKVVDQKQAQRKSLLQSYLDQNDDHHHNEKLHHMSTSLDRLGWKKVFIDIRKELPSLRVPSLLFNLPFYNDGDSNDNSETKRKKVIWNRLRKQQVVQSKDLFVAAGMDFTNNNEQQKSNSNTNRILYQLKDDQELPLPIGHNMIVAFSRNPLASYINKGGRPIVDSLAQELVEEIFT